MINMDVAQVNGIDREAFPTQWPPPNYQRELQNHLAHYIVAYDDTRTLEETASRPDSLHSSLVSRIRHWLKIKPYPSKVSPSLPRQYIVGFAGIWIMADDAHITNLAVRKEYQRRSIGELLLLSIINLAGECKARIITLEVRASNVPAQNLYRKFGFVQVGVRHGYYLDNKEDAIIMSTDNIMSYSFQEHLQRLREALYVKGVAG
ncbi:MAG: ribosomal-protein-alanine N-acetyltransferase [Chloroflexi bacterium RBG_16_50_9]|nr:MAG: ribosomal-protein-alanine N-acetyltransferase [Chloroflexi bacterium RBG_16_50_9]